MISSIIITVLVKNIVWDTDSQEDIIENNLPEQVPVQVDLALIRSFDCINKQICNHLSDKYGWLISDYDLEGYSK
tara:strand:- start:211 stop:435 length:225 start_codon:yes stop_codon:yes gene_type:complete